MLLCFYTLRCYRLVLILLSHFFFQFATHFLSVRGLGQAYLLTSFGLCGWLFERLGNVYDCEALAILTRPKISLHFLIHNPVSNLHFNFNPKYSLQFLIPSLWSGA